MAVPGKGCLATSKAAKVGEEWEELSSRMGLWALSVPVHSEWIGTSGLAPSGGNLKAPSQSHWPMSCSKNTVYDTQSGAQDRNQATGRAEGFPEVHSGVQRPATQFPNKHGDLFLRMPGFRLAYF